MSNGVVPRQLRREIEVWQTRHGGSVDRSPDLHARAQEGFAKFLAGTASRRLAEHRTALITTRAAVTVGVLEAAPGLEDYTPDMWSTYHELPLTTATLARVHHREAMERLEWPSWRRSIHDILHKG